MLMHPAGHPCSRAGLGGVGASPSLPCFMDEGAGLLPRQLAAGRTDQEIGDPMPSDTFFRGRRCLVAPSRTRAGDSSRWNGALKTTGKCPQQSGVGVEREGAGGRPRRGRHQLRLLRCPGSEWGCTSRGLRLKRFALLLGPLQRAERSRPGKAMMGLVTRREHEWVAWTHKVKGPD